MPKISSGAPARPCRSVGELVEGTRVVLSFKLGDGLEFSRVPATIAHYGPAASGGGMRFEPWLETDRLRLLEYLVASYESAGEG